MKNMRFILILVVVLFLTPIGNISGDQKNENYIEKIKITIFKCNYLEYIQEFSNHSFLIKINIPIKNLISEFTITNRYNFSNLSIDLGSVCVRYFKIRFEVYEIIKNDLLTCDLNIKQGIGFADIIFDSFTGFWLGDDQIGDPSGYGRFNGCDDGSFYEFERDFELCFSIDIIDPDNDHIPRWYEENIYHTDPYVDDSCCDDDLDKISLFWEYRWEYDPFEYENHTDLDPDNDGLSNYEEYIVSNWNSDPFCKDMFVELDQMELGPDNNSFFVSNITKIMLYQTYAKRNIIFHIDDGCMGEGEIIPFDSMLWLGEEKKYYEKYFLKNDKNNWRRGVFRYALFVNDHFLIKGLEFPGENSLIFFYKPGLNSFVISTKAFSRRNDFEIACIIMHELGHTLGMCMGRPLGCDNQLMRLPFNIQKYIFKNYKSVMNYMYAFKILDYSDGTHGFADFDDWDYIDLTYFQPEGAS